MTFFDLSFQPGQAPGFGVFTPAHGAWLLLCAFLTAALCAAYRRAGLRRRRHLALGVAFTALGLEWLRALALAAAGEYGLEVLPLHLCAVAVYLLPLHALGRGELTGQFLYAFCLPGALAALLTPDWSVYPALHLMSFLCFSLHTLTAAYVLMLVLGGTLRPDSRALPACIGLMLLLAGPVYVFDLLTGTNYMFLNWPPAGTPLAWFASWGRLFVFGYPLLFAAGWLLMYLPFHCKNRKSAD